MSRPLRQYQADAISALWNHIQTRPDNPCIVIPTGGGKSVILSKITMDVVAWKGRIIILSHVKELIQQVAEHIAEASPELQFGIYSAGLKSRDLGYPVTIAGIQSVYDKAEDVGHVDVIAIDEAHRIPTDGEGMYRTFIDGVKKVNPNVRLIGLTATPFRLQSGMICEPGNILNKVCYEAHVRRLIVDGFLSTLKSKTTVEKFDVSQVAIRGGEFVQSELQAALMADAEKVASACLEICSKTQDRKSVIVFCAGIDHARQVANFIREYEVGEVREVYGDTPAEERARSIRDFREGRVRYLVNVDVLTTGFDAPGVDAVAILRSTMSPGLWCQMVGRGLRKAPGKSDGCLVLDFGGNLMRHGPIDRLLITEQTQERAKSKVPPVLWKECPTCLEVAPRSAGVCLDCGYKFPVESSRKVGHDGKTSDKEVLSGPEDVKDVEYSLHLKMKDGAESKTLRVDYHIGYMYPVSEWVCFEHKIGFARQKAVTWWRQRSDKPVPSSIAEALEIIHADGIKEPKQITLKSEGKYWRIDQYLDMQHRKLTASSEANSQEENVPF